MLTLLQAFGCMVSLTSFLCLRNQSYSTNQSIPISFVYHYRTLQLDDVADILITRHSEKACFNDGNNTLSFQFDEDFAGTHYSYILKQPSVRMVKVLDAYDRVTKKIEIEFKSDWDSITGVNATENIRNAIVNSTFSRISFSTITTPDAYGTCGTIPLVHVDSQFCLNQDLYEKILGERPKEQSNVSCQIGYNRQSKYYMGLWDSVAPAGSIFYKRCILNVSNDVSWIDFQADAGLFNDYPAAFGCHRQHGGNTLFCRDPVLKVIWISNSAHGFMKSMTAHMEYDVTDGITLDMTIDLKEWNVDFSDVFLNTFNYCSFKEPIWMKLDLYVKKDKPPEVPPEISVMYYVYAIMILVPCVVLVLALLMLICTCSARGLELEIWDYAKPCTCLDYLDEFPPPRKESGGDEFIDRKDNYKLSELP